MKNYMKLFIRINLTMVMALCACLLVAKVDVSAKKKTTSYINLSEYSTSEDERVKVGSYYFYGDGDSYYATKSETAEGAEIISEIEGAFLTNGKYAYYAKNGYLYKVKISSKKKTKIKKVGEGFDVAYVYSSSIYYNDCSESGVAQIRCYNSKKKTDKAIASNVDALSITAAGKYIVYADSDTKALQIRNCSKGTVKTIDDTDSYYVRTNGKKVVYVTKDNGSNTIMSYDIASGANYPVYDINAMVAGGKFSADCNMFAYDVMGTYYTLDLNTKIISVINAGEYAEFN